MSSYNGVSFQCIGDGGQFATVERDADGLRRFLASIRIDSLADRNSLAALISVCTIKRIYGRLDGIIHVEAGSGAKTLVVPTVPGTLGTETAVLVSFTNVRAERQAGRFTADAEWVLL